MKKSVLVVVKNPHILAVIKTALEKEGLEVHGVLSVIDASQLYYNKECDIVISDLLFLTLNDFQLLKSLREGKHGKKNDSPILVITSSNEESLALISLYSGIEVFEPPFSTSILEEKVRTILTILDDNKSKKQKQKEKSGKNSEENFITLKKGDLLIREGELEHKMFWIKEGKLEVVKDYEGKRIDFGELNVGEVVGELSFIDELPRSASVVALTDCKVVEIPHQTFYIMMNKQPQFIKSLIRTLCFRLRATDSKFKV